MLATQLKYDLLMFSREIFYLVFAIVIPPITYIFMGQLYGEMTYDHGLNYAQSYTPSFILLITFTVVFFAFGFDQVTHRTTGVEKRIRLSPVPKNILLTSSILRAIIITTIGYLMIFGIGLVMYDLSFDLMNVLTSYVFFILMNVALLIMASAIYSFFKNMNSALVFSIVIMQVVIFTGGFAQPINLMPKFVQVIAELNPLYHMNNMFKAVWNGQLSLSNETLISLSYIGGVLIVSILLIRFMHKRKI
ncbi:MULTISPECIES: ABC transporter permease [unclassified Psychrobacillus]|uniref:ABC transporter permease n=1 Tax=unclassified Psychrobacillus TaxID=2636677 RepID=UPI001243DD27|nr:ABC transporter permease [Psychrobacillus sp. AK 1817]QEY21946.1 ABC transporter permease [Psychrobacillus sp. AK 1817]